MPAHINSIKAYFMIIRYVVPIVSTERNIQINIDFTEIFYQLFLSIILKKKKDETLTTLIFFFRWDF